MAFDGLRSEWPSHTLTGREVSDVELLSIGSVEGAIGFEGPGGLLTLQVDAELAVGIEASGGLMLIDPEGVAMARLVVESTYAVDGERVGVVGAVHPVDREVYGRFALHRRAPHEVAKLCGGAFLTVPVARALTRGDLDDITSRAAGRPTVLLVLHEAVQPMGAGSMVVRAAFRAAELLPNGHVVVSSVVPRTSAVTEDELVCRVVAAFADAGGTEAVWPSPEHELPPEIAAGLWAAGGRDAGVVLFFTGLSGSGKSTVARAVVDAIAARSNRPVTTLDGDVVRLHLSSGLGFSAEDRQTNVRRIGWVAAEIARHGGVAVASAIAPSEAVRQQARGMAAATGAAFVLVHVNTPLGECERRDRKGLYARVRAGEIAEFTGISSPYEVPPSPEIRIDTSVTSVEESRDRILAYLEEHQLLADDSAGSMHRTVRQTRP